MKHSLTTAYGLIFRSELPLPEFLPVEAAEVGHAVPDVEIRIGAVPEHLDNPLGSGVLFEASRSEFLMWVPDIARYLVRNGNEIIVEPAPGVDNHEVRVFMLGSGIGALLHQRQLFVLHASAIAGPAGAFLFAGKSGVGKSTVLGELMARGHTMIVDDVCAIRQSGPGEFTVLPGYPRTRLWADSAAKLKIDTNELVRTRPALDKFEMQLRDQFWNQEAPLTRLYVLSTHTGDDILVEPLPKVHSFAVVLQHTYRRRFMTEMELGPQHFALGTQIAAATSVIQVRRPQHRFRLDALADAIESDMAAANAP